MSQHKTHYENGCKFGRIVIQGGRKMGVPLHDFYKSLTPCAACERKASAEWEECGESDLKIIRNH